VNGIAILIGVACAKVRLSFGAVQTLNVLEAEELLRLCRGGRLYDVEKWITSGRSLAMPAGTRNTPLGIAISMGFHSLAELLARHETQEQKNHALRDAVRDKKWEYAPLLLAHGADLKSVPVRGEFLI
jgi:hypothetical protein